MHATELNVLPTHFCRAHGWRLRRCDCWFAGWMFGGIDLQFQTRKKFQKKVSPVTTFHLQCPQLILNHNIELLTVGYSVGDNVGISVLIGQLIATVCVPELEILTISCTLSSNSTNTGTFWDPILPMPN